MRVFSGFADMMPAIRASGDACVAATEAPQQVASGSAYAGLSTGVGRVAAGAGEAPGGGQGSVAGVALRLTKVHGGKTVGG